MRFLSSREFKIFISFFFIYAFFVHWTGWVENSHFDLTRSIADEQKFEIDNFYNNTGDKAYFDSHYYSNKAPGLSFLATPVYAAWKFIFYNFFPGYFIESKIGNDMHITNFFSGIPIITYVNPEFFVFVSMIIVTIFTSSLFSALTVILIYKISKYFTKNEKQRLLITLTYGLGTLAFPYATVFFSHATETFFAFLAFYLLFKIKRERLKNYKIPVFLAGISSGFAVTIDYSAFLILIGLIGFSLSIKKKNTLFYFILGAIIGIMPLLLYNFAIFGHPFDLTINYSDTNVFPPRFQLNTLSLPIILQMLIFPYRGLFFYCPILILSFIGLFYMYKAYKSEVILILYIFIAFLLLFSMMLGWWGGTSFGLRYLLPITPFLMLPLFYVFKKINFNIILCFVIISIFINFLGLQTWENNITNQNSVFINSTYQEQINKIQFFKSPIYDNYLPSFLENGPRSRIFENIANGNINIDIRDSDFSKPVLKDKIYLFTLYPFGFVLLKLPFLSLIIIGIVIFLIWKKETFTFLKHRIKLSFKHKMVFILLLLIIFTFLFFNTSDIIYRDKWYSLEESENISYRWMSQDATISIYAPTISLARLNFIMNSYKIPRNLDIYLNDNFISSFDVTENGTDITTPILTLREGENKILLHSREGCTSIYKVENNTDIRCLSFTVRNTDIIVKNLINLIDAKHENNWYNMETENEIKFRWMSQNATLFIFNPNNYTEKMKLSFIADTFYKPRMMEIYLNHKLIEEYNISRGMYITTPLLNLNPGENTILFHSKDGCDVPSKIENSTDTRCLSFRFENIKVDLNDK